MVWYLPGSEYQAPELQERYPTGAPDHFSSAVQFSRPARWPLWGESPRFLCALPKTGIPPRRPLSPRSEPKTPSAHPCSEDHGFALACGLFP